MRSKELINSLYGMCAQNPVKPDVIYMDEPDQAFTLEDIVDIGEKLEKYNKKAFLLYAWGCWVTAWARLKLKEMINIVGDNFVYCDTDSVKFLVRDDYKRIVARIEEYNQGLKELSISNKGYADDKKGITHYLGVYEYEETYKQFKTLGAKKYAYTRQDGTFKITIAGVPKKAGREKWEQSKTLMLVSYSVIRVSWNQCTMTVTMELTIQMIHQNIELKFVQMLCYENQRMKSVFRWSTCIFWHLLEIGTDL